MAVKEQLRKLMKRKKSNVYYAEKLKITVGEVILLKQEILKERNQKSSNRNFSEDINKGTAELQTILTSEIKNLEDLVVKCNIDTTVWNIDKYVQNFWGNDDRPQYQVKAWLSKIKKSDVDSVTEFIESYKSTYVPLKKDEIFINNKYSEKDTLFLSISDFHLDKLHVTSDNSLEDRCSLYMDMVKTIVLKAYASNNIDKIVYCVGNDFFNTDNKNRTTTAGTPQEVITTTENAYEVGFDLHVNAISFIKQFCNVLDVVLMPGNHDSLMSYCLTHALSMYFRTDDNINFDITPNIRKAIKVGNTAIMLCHGDGPNMKKLPLMFASEFSQLWGETKYHECLIGHIHAGQESEIDGVKVTVIPSLSGTDKWHEKNGYHLSIQESIGIVYSPTNGRCNIIIQRK